MRLIRVPTAIQLADMLTKKLHFLQWQACRVAGILGKKLATTQEPLFSQGYQVESRR
jgi:hypothetical protein